MIISDLDYLDSISEVSTVYITGGKSATAISGFSALAIGDSTYTDTVVKNFSSTKPNGSSTASSSVRVISLASGGNAYSSSTAVSYSSVG